MQNISQEDVAFLEAQQEHWATVRADFTKNLDMPLKKEFLSFYKRNIDKNFEVNLNCGSCMLDMLKPILRFYDRWKAEQAAVIASYENDFKEEAKRKKGGKK